MNRLFLKSDQKEVNTMLKMFERRIASGTSGLCPVDVTRSFLSAYHSQSCGKCTPCRIGVGQICKLLDSILDGKGSKETVDKIRKIAETLTSSAD
ncbi:MAG: NADH-ubiquinone oxidoreductase-F iron-sulfur binding region domain-containing protein, partial [Spirochaetales bacterium]|nr:NADH-ubiquinone oxidoreductase-F iron-sulfur binding region domain-containing protein [Spirochaetales bacterium]